MVVDIHSVKPRARLTGRTWIITCPILTVHYCGTLDEALKCWRANRLHYQINHPRWCVK